MFSDLLCPSDLRFGCDPVDEAEKGHGEEDPNRDKELPDGSAASPALQVPTPDRRQHLLADRMGHELHAHTHTHIILSVKTCYDKKLDILIRNKYSS